MTRNFTQNFVGGRRVDPLGADFIEVRSPYDGSQVGAVPLAAQADVDLAVATARKAFDEGAWPRMPVVDRIAVIRRFAEFYETRSDEFAGLVTAEMGAPAWFAKAIQTSFVIRAKPIWLPPRGILGKCIALAIPGVTQFGSVTR
ncbi:MULTISPECIES: aldehyde dehydrogenase family protein [unclassified Mesorhizobium]|uniref:aldehyde dehydrogenase family protein n=1 Tax=unclassified Mesorhizobium TaxID=325217 RepID=UPI001AEDEAC2|nr:MULTISPECIES: aldehyde dehydrogenase family protein [unclassified Mesorhizobium]